MALVITKQIIETKKAIDEGPMVLITTSYDVHLQRCNICKHREQVWCGKGADLKIQHYELLDYLWPKGPDAQAA
jgi:hypothetical protein